MSFGFNIPNQRSFDIAYFRDGEWVVLHPGTSGKFLQTKGTTLPPVWTSVSVTGQIVCYDAVVDSSGIYGTHTTIQSAIVSLGLAPGGTPTGNPVKILVFSGSYNENVSIVQESFTSIVIEGCPGILGMAWEDPASSIGNSNGVTVIAQGNNPALTVTSSFAGTFPLLRLKGIVFLGATDAGNPPAVLLQTNSTVAFEECGIFNGTNSSLTYSIKIVDGGVAGNGILEFIRTGVSALSVTSGYSINNISSETPPIVIFRESASQGAIDNAWGQLWLDHSYLEANGVTAYSGGGLTAVDSIINQFGAARGVLLNQPIGIVNFFSIKGTIFHADTGFTQTAIKLTSGGNTFSGNVEGNIFIRNSVGNGWLNGVDIGGNVNCIVLGNSFVDCTNPVITNSAYPLSTQESAPTAHAILSASHADTLAAGVVRGDMPVGNATPKWARVAIGAANKVWHSDGTDPSWQSLALADLPVQPYVSTADATVANTATETTLIGTGVGTLTLPANFFIAGRTIRIQARGYFSSTNLGPTLRLKIKLGSTVLLDTGAQALALLAATTREWMVDAAITCRTIGASGSVIGQGLATLMDLASAVGSATSEEMSNVGGATTIDTTATQAVGTTAQWGTASASNTITCTNFTLEVV